MLDACVCLVRSPDVPSLADAMNCSTSSLPTVQNANYPGADVRDGFTTKYTCSTGYSGAPQVQCNAGTWDPVSGSCLCMPTLGLSKFCSVDDTRSLSHSTVKWQLSVHRLTDLCCAVLCCTVYTTFFIPHTVQYSSVYYRCVSAAYCMFSDPGLLQDESAGIPERANGPDQCGRVHHIELYM